MTDLSTSYFTNKTSGFAAPQPISAPDSGYIIVKVYNSNSSLPLPLSYAIRYYKG